MGGELTDRVRAGLLERRGGAPVVDVDAALEGAVRRGAAGIVDDVVFAALRREVSAELVGAGPLEALLAAPGVTDVLAVTAPDAVWLDRGRGLERTAVRFADDAAVRRLAQRLVAATGRRLDDAQPYADAALRDGTRLHAILPPLTPTTTLSLRVLARRRLSVGDLVAGHGMSAEVAGVLVAAVRARLAVLVSGGTGTGKTTLLGALLGEVAPSERIVVIEDSRELVIDHPHVVRMCTRAANVEGAGAVGLRELVAQALRMRPDRVVVGEFRGAEMVDLLVSLNTGHEGGAATMHANSSAAVPARLTALGGLGGTEPGTVAQLAANAFDVLVHLRRSPGGQRAVAELGVLSGSASGLGVEAVWSAADGWGGAADGLIGRLGERGFVPVTP